MKDLSYKDILGNMKTHQEVLKKNLINGLIDIIMEERSISEKDFKKQDFAREEVCEIINNDHNILTRCEEHLQLGKRMNLIYELLYDDYYSNQLKINENYMNNKINNFDEFIFEKKSSVERDINKDIIYLRGMDKEMKDVAREYVTSITRASKGKITGLSLHKELKKKIADKDLPNGFSMGMDGDGYYIHTHRARSKSYKEPGKISVKDIKFIDSTG